MATADYWSSADLKGLAQGGMIKEDVMSQIWDISNVPLTFTDMLGSDSHTNSYYEWTIDRLADPNVNNAVVDGADSNQNDSKGGQRVGNHGQISIKEVQVTQRAQASGTVYAKNELAKQLMERQKELRRDIEAISCSNQGSQSDNGDDTPGLIGAFGAWLTTNTDRTGADGGFSNGVVSAPTPGLKQALTETKIRDMASQIWEGGGNPSCMMSVPAVIRGISEYMFTDAARIATLQADQGKSASAATAMGSVNVFVTDFGVTLEMKPNRLQQTYKDSGGTEDVADLFFIDSGYVRQSFLQGYNVKPLSKVGLTDKRLMNVDWGLKVLNEEAHGVISEVDIAAAVTA